LLESRTRKKHESRSKKTGRKDENDHKNAKRKRRPRENKFAGEGEVSVKVCSSIMPSCRKKERD
jgi:hypothetical protein